MKNQSKKMQERELDRLFRKILENKIIKYIKQDLSYLLLSFGLGSITYFYLINYLQRNIIGKVKDKLEVIINTDNVDSLLINNIDYLLIGLIMIILSILFINKSEKTKNLILLFITSIVFLAVGIIAIVILKNNILFSILSLLSIIVLIYVLINVLKNIYSWLKVDKNKDNQIDVAKLTFIWGIIIFLYSLLK